MKRREGRREREKEKEACATQSRESLPSRRVLWELYWMIVIREAVYPLSMQAV